MFGKKKSSSSPTVKAAKNDAARRTGGRGGAAGRQEALGVRHTQQNHVCHSTCDSPCPVATRSND